MMRQTKFSIHGIIEGEAIDAAAIAHVVAALPGVSVNGFETENGPWGMALDTIPVEDLGIDTATKNALRKAGLQCVGDLRQKSIRSLSLVYQIGRGKRLKAILEELEQLGVFLEVH